MTLRCARIFFSAPRTGIEPHVLAWCSFEAEFPRVADHRLPARIDELAAPPGHLVRKVPRAGKGAAERAAPAARAVARVKRRDARRALVVFPAAGRPGRVKAPAIPKSRPGAGMPAAPVPGSGGLAAAAVYASSPADQPAHPPGGQHENARQQQSRRGRLRDGGIPDVVHANNEVRSWGAHGFKSNRGERNSRGNKPEETHLRVQRVLLSLIHILIRAGEQAAHKAIDQVVEGVDTCLLYTSRCV